MFTNLLFKTIQLFCLGGIEYVICLLMVFKFTEAHANLMLFLRYYLNRCGFATEVAPRHIIPSAMTHTVNGKVGVKIHVPASE